MNPNLTSAVSELSKGRAERSNKPFLRAFVPNLIARVEGGRLHPMAVLRKQFRSQRRNHLPCGQERSLLLDNALHCNVAGTNYLCHAPLRPRSRSGGVCSSHINAGLLESGSERGEVEISSMPSLTGFLITFCVGVAATLGWQSYGDAARERR
jgi:hypothetical protein